MPKIYAKDIRDIKGCLRLEAVFDPLVIVAVAIHRDPDRNRKVRIPCSHSTPLPGYVYSTIRDTFSVRCCDHCHLGTIEVSYFAEMRGTAGWRFRVPMPEAAVRRYLGLEQRRKYREFRDRHRGAGDLITFEFVQMVSAY